MDFLEFYKGLFEQELENKKWLDGAVNVPIGIIVLIAGAFSFVYKEIDISYLSPLNAVYWLIVFLLALCIFFLTKSYNNLFMGFDYDNLPQTQELYNYQQEISEYNTKVEKKERENFETYLMKNYVSMSDKNGKINKSRLLNLYRAKAFLIGAVLLTILLSIFYALKTALT